MKKPTYIPSHSRLTPMNKKWLKKMAKKHKTTMTEILNETLTKARTAKVEVRK